MTFIAVATLQHEQKARKGAQNAGPQPPRLLPAHEELVLGRAVACDEEAAPPGCKAVTRAGSAWSSSPFCQLNKGGKSRPAHNTSSSISDCLPLYEDTSMPAHASGDA